MSFMKNRTFGRTHHIWQYCPPEDRERQFLREAQNKLIQTPSFRAIDHLDKADAFCFPRIPNATDPSEPRMSSSIPSSAIRYLEIRCDSSIPREDGTLEVDLLQSDLSERRRDNPYLDRLPPR
jgi:hypothetical protein